MFVVPSKMYAIVFVDSIMKQSPGLFVCLMMEDVPGGDGVASETGEGEMIGEPHDGVWEMADVLGGDGVIQPPVWRKGEWVQSINEILIVTCHRIHLYEQ